MSKFEKNRSVDRNWYQVPMLYILDYSGTNKGQKMQYKKVLKTFEEMKEEYESYWGGKYHKESYEYAKKKNYDFLYKKVKNNGEPDKTLTIIQIYGSKALCAWRNEESCKMGMARMYPLIKKGKDTYLLYKGKQLKISKRKSGWVI